ncbi:MAG: precorrin-6y C5,15-methyltransferase (decarboxylating) subunit CbiE [Rhizobiaceae bacterium]|jgi:precorrin-6Y C5,15-methyltransferase (decarboxylating)|nr:precorrin-6y C5,15-methyltransferase (decarboxylating) subunit CbiE [Rhizobiaceae bacterium]
MSAAAKPDRWLTIIGIGEDGLAGLSPAARTLVETAEVIIGGDRHHHLAENITAERLAWPSPFDAMIEVIKAQKGRRVVILVTGDPLWFSVGARIVRGIPAEEISFHPQLSAFQWAAARMGWSLADCETLTIHGRPPENILPFVAPCARLLLLTKDGSSPDAVAALLKARGYGASAMTVLGALGGPNETRLDATAEQWAGGAPEFHVLAVECLAGPGAQVLPRTGLPDACFAHDGKLTKQAVRAVTLAKLAPHRGAVLWDVGAGSGAIGIEWMRAAHDAQAYGIEPRADRRAVAAQNALALGAPRLKLIDGEAPAAFAGLPVPNAVFFGGGISHDAIESAMDRLAPLGRLVANAVTLESEAVLLAAFAKHKGSLQRISVETADPVGPFHGWRPAMPVTQWHWVKPWA